MNSLHDILTVAVKEIRAALKDRVILAQMILVPFAIIFGYGMLMSVMNDAMSKTDDSGEVSAFVINVPEYMKDGFKELKMESVQEDKAAEIRKDIEKKNSSLLVVFPEDFAIRQEGDLSNIEIWYNSEDSTSTMKFAEVNAYLNAFQPKVFLINSSEDGEYDLGDPEAVGRNLLAALLPMMLLFAIFNAGNGLAAESIAGDKERGFLNTILIAPVKRRSIAAGKAIFIFTVGVVSGLSAFVGMAFSIPKLAEAVNMEKGLTYGAQDYLLLFVVTMSAVFALYSAVLIISTLAKGVRQSSTLASIPLLAISLLGMLASMDGFRPIVEKLGMLNYVIPVWNSISCIQDIIRLEYLSSDILISCGLNLVFSVAMVLVMGRLFESEKIVNG